MHALPVLVVQIMLGFAELRHGLPDEARQTLMSLALHAEPNAEPTKDTRSVSIRTSGEARTRTDDRSFALTIFVCERCWRRAVCGKGARLKRGVVLRVSPSRRPGREPDFLA